jgi:tetratricopeptide (TPR) repeat protein
MRDKSTLRRYFLLCMVLIFSAALPATPQEVVLQIAAVEPQSGVTTPASRVTVRGIGFSADAVVYFGGLQVRETNFLSPSRLEVVTPYLRPGTYQLQIKSGGATLRSEVSFTSVPSPIDAEIDRAVALAQRGQTTAAVDLLITIAKTHSDHQVRAFAHYQIGQVYFAQGDLLSWSWTTVFLDSDKSGMAVQTSWRYRLDSWLSEYLFNRDTETDHDFKSLDWVVKYDITQNPEPRFYRGLVNARYGNLKKAKEDSDFILKLEPRNPSYRALAAYVAVLGGDETLLNKFAGESITEARALSLLGEAAYLGGDSARAQTWWILSAKEYPLGAGLALLAGKKHLARGHKQVAAALLTECTIMAPNSKEAEEARDLLAKLGAAGS